MASSPSIQLAAAVTAAAATFRAARSDADDGEVAYSVGETVVVVVTGGTAEFRLRPDVAAAAARTTDCRSSQRGPEWVALTPSNVDRFTRDRIEAWFEFAVRRVPSP